MEKILECYYNKRNISVVIGDADILYRSTKSRSNVILERMTVKNFFIYNLKSFLVNSSKNILINCTSSPHHVYSI